MMFGISIIVSFLLARQISRPIVQLASATQRVSRGEIDVQLDLDEEGYLVQTDEIPVNISIIAPPKYMISTVTIKPKLGKEVL